MVLLGLVPALAAVTGAQTFQAFSVFYKAGALVFGGGHVVLPLLQTGVVPNGWLSNDAFLAGYGAAQAVPGPLFTFAAYLGALMPFPLGGWGGGLAILAVIFLPAFLLVAGAFPFWEFMRQRDGVQRAMGGINAAVVGAFGAALYDPVWTSAIRPAPTSLLPWPRLGCSCTPAGPGGGCRAGSPGRMAAGPLVHGRAVIAP